MALPANTWIEEFLYRGRPAGDPREPAWHLLLGTEIVDPLNETTKRVTRMFNIAQAQDLGVTLPDLIAAINADAMAERDRVVAERDALRAERDELKAALKRK